jgi:TRAP-type C4-dicarboxylate transport system permease small subunit
MSKINWLQNWLRMHSVIMVVTCSMLGFVALSTTMNVMLRLMGSHIQFIIEINEMLLVAIIMLGISLAQSRKRHIKTQFFVHNLPIFWQHLLEAIGCSIGIFLFATIMMESAKDTWSAIIGSEYFMGIPGLISWPSKSFVTLGSFLVCLQLLFDVIVEIRTLIKGDGKEVATPAEITADSGVY